MGLDEQDMFRLQLGDDPSTGQKSLDALRKLQGKISEEHLGSHEVFDFGLYTGPSGENAIEKRLGH